MDRSTDTRTVMIGDLVASRASRDRPALHATVASALAEVNSRWGTDLRITVGDEFQGTVPGVGAASVIALQLRLALLPGNDLRVGVGRGATAVLDAAAGIEDGPGWWVARAAIEEVEDRARRAATRHARTAFRSADEADDDLVRAVDAALLGRDELVGAMGERSLSVLRGLLSGSTQRELAEEEGVSASAVSQRVRHDGIGVVVSMTEWMETIR